MNGIRLAEERSPRSEVKRRAEMRIRATARTFIPELTALSGSISAPESVCPGRQTCSVGRRPTGARARRPVAWMAERRETEVLKPIDEAVGWTASEWPGRNVSERKGSPESANLGGRACAFRAKAVGTVAVWLTRQFPSGGV